jgi:transcription elongation GreA/GreB family factor
MDAELQQLVDTEQLDAALAAKLEALKPGSCCQHRSWGNGKVKSWDTAARQIIIDFIGKPGHPMTFEFAASSLKPLPPTHVISRLLDDPAAVRAEAQASPVAFMRNVVQSLGKDASAERIEATLVPALFAPAEWKKWWDAAKREMKKDPHFTVPSRRTEPITLHDAPPDRKQSALEAYRAAVGAKAKIPALEELARHWKEINDPAVFQEVNADVESILAKMPASQAALAVELCMARDDFAAAAGQPPQPAAFQRFLPRELRQLVTLLEALPAAKQGKCLERIKLLNGDQWPNMAAALMPLANSRLAEVIIASYKADGRFDQLLSLLARLIRERNLHYDFLHWLGRNRTGEFASLINVELFGAILSVLEFEQLGGTRKASRLEDLLLTDKELLKALLASASEDQIRDVARAVLQSPAFNELDKRSLLASLVKLYPYVQSMISKAEGGRSTPSAAAETQQPIIVSWESLRRRQAELEELVQKKIPENSREISVARSYGDLRENHEFKAAKEMQTVLMRRKAELEAMLVAAQGTDFKNVSTSEVNIGTVVDLTVIATGEKLTYTILGAWDSDPEKGIISYMTAVASALMKKPPGAEVDLPQEGNTTRRVRIDSIRPYVS